MNRRKLSLCSIIVAVAAAGFLAFRSSDADAIATASVWARLAPIPSSAHQQHVEVNGSMFTRQFVITFTAPPSDVRDWVQASAGPASARRSIQGAEMVYSITPGGGAQFAEVRINETTGQVTIRAYWS